MHVTTAFEPDPARAEMLVTRMQRELSASLQEVMTACRVASVSPPAPFSAFCQAMTEGMDALPEDFARYFRTVQSIQANQIDDALTEMAAFDVDFTKACAKRFHLWGQDDLFEAMIRDRFTDADQLFAPIPTTERAGLTDHVNAALALIENVTPDLHAEITTLVRDIVLTIEPPNSNVRFDGGSHYQLWGLLVLNPRSHDRTVLFAEALVHEAAHLFLFGLTVDEPLVLNSDEERFVSPLRDDRRPMDGIFHATFVTARMAYFLSKVAQKSRFSDDLLAVINARIAANKRAFEDGCKIVADHGRLSPTGRQVIDGAVAAMARL